MKQVTNLAMYFYKTTRVTKNNTFHLDNLEELGFEGKKRAQIRTYNKVLNQIPYFLNDNTTLYHYFTYFRFIFITSIIVSDEPCANLFASKILRQT